MTLIARFRLEGHEQRRIEGLDAGWLDLATFEKSFYSGIVGSATTVFCSAGTEEGSRSYVATEQVTGETDDGRSGSFVVQHGGLESDESTWFGHIVPGTGTGDFAGWHGSCPIKHDDEGPFFEIDLA